MRTPGRRIRAAWAALLLALAGSAGAADDATGAALYERECSKCHGRLVGAGAARGAAGPVRVAARRGDWLAFAMPFGPSLAGVVGRPAASLPGYEYSRALVAATEGLVWSRPTLHAFIGDTQAFAPGTRMYYRQPDATVRGRIIDYLSTVGPR